MFSVLVLVVTSSVCGVFDGSVVECILSYVLSVDFRVVYCSVYTMDAVYFYILLSIPVIVIIVRANVCTANRSWHLLFILIIFFIIIIIPILPKP